MARDDIRQHMDVVGSDGGHVGTVDKVEGERIKLTKADARDHAHHYIPLADVARDDAAVHLRVAAAAALAAAGGGAGASQGGGGPLPPVANPAVDHSRPRGNYYLPWILLGIAIIAVLLLAKSCLTNVEAPAPVPAQPTTGQAPAAAPLPVETVTLPGGRTIELAPGSLNYTLQEYLASNAPAPRTFTFDKLNFDTGSAAIRAEDQANVDALAQVLAAYPNARGEIVGYTDARGSGASNAGLGQQRADAVVAALGAKGVAAGRLTARTGGEANPTDSNATAAGQFENRRTELVVTAK